MRSGAVWVALALAGAVACAGASAFTCSDDSQCSADVVRGVCQPDGLCSFPDPDCTSGQRYGENSGSLSGQCVPVPGTTTVSDTTSTSGPPPGTTSEVGGSTSAAGDTTTTTTTGLPPADSSSGGGESSTGEAVDPSLVLWLPFDPATPFEDASTYANPVACPKDQCPEVAADAATFDGQGEALQIPDAPHFDTPGGYTIAAWVQLDPAAELQIGILTKPLSVGIFNTWELYFYRDAGSDALDLWFCMADGPNDVCVFQTMAIDAVAQGFHAAATFDPPTATLWVDGQPAESFDVAAFTADTGPIFVGADRDNGVVESFFTGILDDIRVYDRALDAAELATLAAR